MKYGRFFGFVLGTAGYILLSTVDYKIIIGVLLIRTADLFIEA